MTFDKLSDAIKTHAVLMSETNKEVAQRATVQHVTGHLYAVTVSHADAARPKALDVFAVDVRLVCSNHLHAH